MVPERIEEEEEPPAEEEREGEGEGASVVIKRESSIVDELLSDDGDEV